MMYKKCYLLLAGCLFMQMPSAVAMPLKEVLKQAFTLDPTLDEAKANIQVAQSQTKISEAGHYPIISLAGTSVINQKHVYTSERRSGPSVVGRLNLYAWGAIEAEVERDRFREGYYEHRYDETRELLGQQIAQLYLTALRAKENIAIYEESLVRHEKILGDLEVIARHDEGRYSDVNEALSRRNQVESTILSQKRIMHTALNRLSRYTPRVLEPEDLIDPFVKVTAASFTKQYKNPDIKTTPSYLAQQQESESARAAVKAAAARRMPAINLEGNVSRREHELYLSASWDIFNPAAKYTEQQSFYSQRVAEARLQEIELTAKEQALTSEADMHRNEQLMAVTKKQIKLQENVVNDNELKFSIASRTLIDLLDSYQELTNVQAARVAAHNDFRDAALLYLVSQARVTEWVGFTDKSSSSNQSSTKK